MPRWLAVQYLQLYQSYGFESKFHVRHLFHGKRISSQIWPETRTLHATDPGSEANTHAFCIYPFPNKVLKLKINLHFKPRTASLQD